MRLVTPPNLHYPITVTKLLRSAGEQVERNVPLFNYYYKSIVVEGDEDNKEGKPVERTWPSTFESYVEGEISEWFIAEGAVITRPHTAIVEIEEPCKHEVQFGGMCADCGKDMTTVAYNTTTRDTSRATVNTVHGHTQLLVSQAQASKSDEEAKRRLLSSRKLSLVVDLDQTIIHATVDPTVAEWQHDVSNPNHDAVKDVQAFQLVDDGGAGSGAARGCWYYIKLRPGLRRFLDNISKYYELHIYTMGTHAYAKNIAKIVDPERKIFAERILSRDTSGSMTVKNLKRLFPVDTKMVVIIDDRGDVWQWSQNLIKVTPYDFFVGIGDINSSFLPKRPGIDAKAATPDKDHVDTNVATTAKPALRVQTEASHRTTTGANGDVSALDQLISMGGGNDPNKLQQQTSQQDETIAAQLADRPLLQKQKILDAAEEQQESTAEAAAETESSPLNGHHQDDARYRHNLLQDDDTELLHLEQSLQSIHRAFFDTYEKRLSGSQGGRVAELRPGHGGKKRRSVDDLDVLPDVTAIMATLKQKVLQGCSLVFSGVVPLGVDIQNHDFAIWAKSFGATVTDTISKRTTHVIASPQRRTAKVRQAAKKPDRINIVTQQWLFDSLSQWKRVDEAPYRIHSEMAEPGDKAAPGNGSPFDEPDQNTVLSSSDEEAALTEEEVENSNGLEAQPGPEHSMERQAELDVLMPSLSREDSSPHEQTVQEWEGMNDELADFLGSEAEDGSESEAESARSSESDKSGHLGSSGKKRKRSVAGMGEPSTTDGEESDASRGGGDSSGSRLQKRKKKALARTSSLTSAATAAAGETAGSTSLRGGQDPGGGPGAIAEEEDDEDEYDEAALEAELEAELLRQDEEEEDGG